MARQVRLPQISQGLLGQYAQAKGQAGSALARAGGDVAQQLGKILRDNKAKKDEMALKEKIRQEEGAFKLQKFQAENANKAKDLLMKDKEFQRKVEADKATAEYRAKKEAREQAESVEAVAIDAETSAQIGVPEGTMMQPKNIATAKNNATRLKMDKDRIAKDKTFDADMNKLKKSKLRADIDRVRLGNVSTRVAGIGIQNEEIKRGVETGEITNSEANDMYRKNYLQIQDLLRNAGVNLPKIKMSSINSATWGEIFSSIVDKITPGSKTKPKAGTYEEVLGNINA